jgi:hypothetical protein
VCEYVYVCVLDFSNVEPSLHIFNQCLLNITYKRYKGQSTKDMVILNVHASDNSFKYTN